MYTLNLAPGVELVLEDGAAESLRRQLGANTAPPGAPSVMADAGKEASAWMLDDDHPLWERHSGREGHYGPEWQPEDSARAEAFYAAISGKAKAFIDLLIDHPGQRIDVDKICELLPEDFSSSRSIAGALNGLHSAY